VSVPTQKRFIAGAVCPRCGAQDRIRVFMEGERTLRECIVCDFEDELSDAGSDVLPKGRLDGPRRPPAASAAKPMTFHPPKRRKSSDA